MSDYIDRMDIYNFGEEGEELLDPENTFNPQL